MSTLPECFYAIMVIDAGHLCVEAAADQGLWRKNMPTVMDWVRSNWYIFVVIGVVVLLSLIGITLSAVRWCRRIQHRHHRAQRNKRVDGMLRLVSASFHGTLSRKSSTVNSRRSSVDGHDGEEGNSEEADGGRGDRLGAFSRRASRRMITSDEENDFDSGADGFDEDDAEEGQFRSGSRRPSAFAPAASAGVQRPPSQALAGAFQAKKKGRRPKKQPTK